jgi:hypothetical protein
VHAVDEGCHQLGEEEIEGHPHHRHDLSGVSGVLYLQLSTDGKAEQGDEHTYRGDNHEPLLLRFHDPRGERTAVDELPSSGTVGDSARITSVPRPPFLSELTVAARRGRLVLFPPWLGHRVGKTRRPGSVYADPIDTAGNEETHGEEIEDEYDEYDEYDDEEKEEEIGERTRSCPKPVARSAGCIANQYRVALSFNLHGDWSQTALSHGRAPVDGGGGGIEKADAVLTAARIAHWA